MPGTDDAVVDEAVEAMRDVVSADTPDGLTVKVTGPAGLSVDLGKVFEGINGRLLVSAAIVVAVLLLITYRSPFLWIIPLLVVGFADRLATALLYGAAKAFDFSTSGQSVGIMAILVFGAGTDYALLLIARQGWLAQKDRKLLDRDYVKIGEAQVVLPEDARVHSRPLEALPREEQDGFLPRLLMVAYNRFGATRSVQDAALWIDAALAAGIDAPRTSIETIGNPAPQKAKKAAVDGDRCANVDQLMADADGLTLIH